MVSVTGRIKQVRQPRGGYLKVARFDVKSLNDGRVLNKEENVQSNIIGTVVDYMTRFMINGDKDKAFIISLMGAVYASKVEEVNTYLNQINGLDDNSIINACKAVTFDVWYRKPSDVLLAKGAKDINPDNKTIENIKMMIERSLKFLEKYGPIKVDGFTFEGGGYTDTVNTGDGDFLTEDTLWDFKVLRSEPKPKNTLQLLMYYIMGVHSGKEEFKSIKKIGIYNPRLNKVYQFELKNIPGDVIKEIEENVICYK